MNVLLISPYFAPYTGVGALRMTSLASYLQRMGMDITVVKIADTCLDEELIKGSRLSGITYAEFIPPSEKQVDAPQLYPIIDALCREKSFDCCIVSFGPFYTVRPAIYVKEHYGIPLVVDYRDLWLYNPRYSNSLRSFLGRCKTKILYHSVERALMKTCSAFVSVTPRSVSSMVRHYPMLKKKSYCIYNGYHDIELGTSFTPCSHETIDLCILGKFSYYTIEGTATLFQAVHALQEKGYPIRIIHIGEKENAVPELLKQSQIPEKWYCEYGQLPYDKALAAAKSTDISAAIVSCTEGLATKVFDYIYLNLPIVAYAPPGSEFEELLTDAENAFVCQTSEQLESAIEKIITENRRHLTNNEMFRQQFSRELQNERYYQLLKSL